MKFSNKELEVQQQKTRSDLLDQYIQYRLLKSMTQQDLAERLQVSRQVVTRFESKEYNPTLDMLVKLADGLGLELEIRLIEKKE